MASMGLHEGRSDAELLKLAMAGEESAFVALYERLKSGIFRYAYYMTSSVTAAEEVTQEVFMSLLEKGSTYRDICIRHCAQFCATGPPSRAYLLAAAGGRRSRAPGCQPDS